MIEFQEDPESSHKKNRSRSRKKTKQPSNARYFIDDAAEEDSDAELGLDREVDKYAEEDLARKNVMPNLEEMQRRYQDVEEDNDDDMDE